MKIFGRLKNILNSPQKNTCGFTLIETLVSVLIVSILMLGFYQLMLLSLKVTADNSFIVEATEIANLKMERIRNMKYDDIGTLTGSPHGLIQEHETVQRSGVYDVHTMVVFYDDPYDGTLALGTDSVFVDYKIATVDVSWQGRFGPKNLTVFSKIVPNTQETLSGYGLLKLMTVDSSGAVVPNASIHVKNASSTVNADYVSDNMGRFDLALLPEFEGYEVTVSKTGYSTEKTYARDAVNLNPTKPNITVLEGVKTEESFSIDKLSNFTIRTVANTLPDNWRVNASTTSDSVKPRISLDQSDNAYIAWQNNGTATSTVLVQKYNSANAKQWTNDLSLSTSSFFQVGPDIATTKAGASYIVWQDNSIPLKQLAYDTSGHIVKMAKSQAPVYETPNRFKVFVVNSLTYWVEKIKSLWRSALAFGKREAGMQKAEAASGVSVVQTKISGAVNNSDTISLNLDYNPTIGNVLIAVAVHSRAGQSFNAPTTNSRAFTVSKYSDSANALDVGIWHKVIQSGDTKNVQITLPSGQRVSGGVLMVMEVSGLDTTSLLDVTSSNDQTSGATSKTAYSGQTATSGSLDFAVVASAFGTNGFNTPSNSNWTSGSSDTWSQQLWTSWSAGTNGSLAIATMNIDATANQSASLTLTGGSNTYRNSALAVFKVAPPNQSATSASGSQNASVVMPQTDYYIGGKFVIAEVGSSRDVNSVKLQEFGTVDAQAKISSVKLFYDFDTTAPYDCASETYNPGSDPQFGSSATFSSADGFATITHSGGANITTMKTLCLYPVVSVSGANDLETLDIKINNPATDVVISTGSSTPSTVVDISGSTTLIAPADIRQVHTRLRKDNGDEASASWRNSQDQSGTIYLKESLRIRFEVANLGGVSSPAMAYRLEYGELISTCDAIATWHAVPSDDSLAWKTIDSTYYADGDSSANIASGLSDEESNFTSSQLKDTGNQTGSLVLNKDSFTEMEFNIKPNSSIGDRAYCFRLSDQGDASSITYSRYAIVSTKGDDNVFIRKIDTNGNFASDIKRVNADASDANQINPAIALIENASIATTAIAWEDDRNGDSDIYLQVMDADNNRIFPTDLRVTTAGGYNDEPALAFNPDGDLYVAWVSGNSNHDIYLSKYNQAGSLLSGPTALKSSVNSEYLPRIKFDSTGNLYLTYTEETGGIKKVVVTKYDSTMAQLWEKNPNKAGMIYNQYDSDLGIYNNTIFSIWSDERNGNKDIYAQKLDTSGNIIWTNDLKVNIGLDTADQIEPTVAVRSNLKAVGVWQDNRNSRNEIYATEFDDPTSLNGVANVPLEIVGTKKIGENPVIYKYNQIHITDANGYLYLSLDWDVPGYSISVHSASSSKSIILRDPPQPLSFSPAESKTMLIYVQ